MFKMAQSASEIIMVRPANFGFDEETSASNSFQQRTTDPLVAQYAAIKEFDEAVELLKRNGISVVVFQDTVHPMKMDAVFPNNWFSTHDDGTIVVYPMQAKNRRLEYREDIINYLRDIYKVNKIEDLRFHEASGSYLEGTGSIVFDYANKVAYAGKSKRTNCDILGPLCSHLGFKSVVFNTADKSGRPIYHTNVIMWIGTTVAAICTEAISADSRSRVLGELRKTGRDIVELAFNEIEKMAGNCLELSTRHGERVLAISRRAAENLSLPNLALLQRHYRFIEATVDTIEEVGGGGIRCMIAAINLQHKM